MAVNITWTKSTSSGVTSQEIYRSEDGTNFSALTTVPNGTDESYQDGTAVIGNLYCYYVVALIGVTPSPDSNIACVNDSLPTVVLTTPTTPTNAAFTVTATFSEAVTGMALADFTSPSANATIANFVAVSTTVYTADYTATSDGAVTAQIPADSAIDSASQGNTISNLLSTVVDTVSPTVTLTTPADPVTGMFVVTAQFSETVTGITSVDFVVVNGTTANFVAVDGDTYTIEVTPTATPVTIDMPANAGQDTAGNNSTAATQLSVVYNAPAVPCNLAKDTFTATNGTLLTAHTMDTGSGWTEPDGVFSIQNNKAEVSVATPGVALTTTNKANTKSGVVVTNGGAGVGLIFRASDSSNFYYAELTLQSPDPGVTQAIQLLKRVAGTFTLIEAVAFAVNINTQYLIEARCNGDSIDIDVDGVNLISYVSSEFNTNTGYGLFSWNTDSSVTNTYDDFCVEDL